MRVLIVTPAPPGSRKGNRITALKWRRILHQLGHRVDVSEAYDGSRCDVLIALHARRSAKSIQTFRKAHPHGELIVALTGTDLYRDINRSRAALRSLETASRLIVFHPQARSELPKPFQAKSHVIYQSATPPRSVPPPRKNVFEVAVVGHLRPVKDPFRAALASVERWGLR